ncbi:MAG: rhomboid family intramembrane serine protease [Deltaproteobacteria bacterium]|nr:rhomboid family intramembrane serine protease [Deltaproteobacteria bacterium]
MVNVGSRFPRSAWAPTRAVLGLLLALLVLQLAYGFSFHFVQGVAFVFDGMSLRTEDVLAGEVWRLASYGLIHSLNNPMHLVINAMMLFFFGRDLEQRWGPWRFLLFVLLGVIAGGVAVVAASLLHIGIGAAIGVSGACEAVVVTWALFNRNRDVLLFMVAPVKGIWLITFAIAMWMLDAVSVSEISAAAHFGGIVFGALAWLVLARRQRIGLFVDDALVALRLKKKPRLTIVPKGPDKWVH